MLLVVIRTGFRHLSVLFQRAAFSMMYLEHVRHVRTDATAKWYTSSPVWSMLCMKWRQMHGILDVMDPISHRIFLYYVPHDDRSSASSQCPVNTCSLQWMNLKISSKVKWSEGKWSEVKWKLAMTKTSAVNFRLCSMLLNGTYNDYQNHMNIPFRPRHQCNGSTTTVTTTKKQQP